MKDRPVRFNDLTRLIGGASKKVIAERLHQLEKRGLIKRKVLDAQPVAVEYRMTTFGMTALACLDELRRWSESLPESLIDEVNSG